MTTQLSPAARDLLGAASHVGEPDPAAVARVRGSLLQRIAAGAATGVGGAASVQAARAATRSWKVMALAARSTTLSVTAFAISAVVAVVAIGPANDVVHAGSEGHAHVVAHRAVSAPSAADAEPAVESTTPASVIDATTSSATATTSARSASDQRDGRANPRFAPKRAAKDGATSTVAEVSGASAVAPSLMQDLAALRRAHAALLAGNPRAALAAVEDVRAEGPLAEEREGIRVLATCELGAPDSARGAEAFLKRRPDSALGSRVQRACFGAD